MKLKHIALFILQMLRLIASKAFSLFVPCGIINILPLDLQHNIRVE